MNYNLPGPSVHGIFQARKLERVAIVLPPGGVSLTQGSNPCLLWLKHCRCFLHLWATREARSLRTERFFWCLLFLNCLQLKIILLPKWHILRWRILIPYSLDMPILPDVQGCEVMAHIETGQAVKYCRDIRHNQFHGHHPQNTVWAAASLTLFTTVQTLSFPSSSSPGPGWAFYREDTSKLQLSIFIVQCCTSFLLER